MTKHRSRHRRHIVKRLSHGQAMLTAGAVATLIIWTYAAWVHGEWPPQPTAESGGALSIIMVTIFVWLFTSEDIVDATTDVTVTGDHPVVAAAAGSSAVGVQQPDDRPDNER